MKRKTESVFTQTVCYGGYLEEALEGEIRLADYYPDAQEILKTELLTQIAGKKCIADKIRVDGSAAVRVYYASSDESRLGSVTLTLPFSKIFDAKKTLPPDTFVDVTTVTQYKNTRLINSRRLEIKASVGISVKAYCKTANEYLVAADEDFEYEQSEVTVGDFLGAAEREQRIVEEFPIPDGMPPVALPVRCDARAKLNEMKSITNKAVLKGDVFLNILYRSENGSSQKAEFSFPVTQIVEIEGIDENSKLCGKITVAEYKAEPVANAEGTSDKIRFEALIVSDLQGYAKKQIAITTDAYSTTCDTSLKYSETVSTELYDVLSLDRAFKETFEYSSGEVSRICDVWGSVTGTDCVKTDAGFDVNSVVAVTILAYDVSGRLCSVDCDVPVTTQIHTQPDGEYSVVPTVSLSSVSFAVTGDGTVELRGSLSVDAAVYKKTSFTAVTDIETAERADNSGVPAFRILYAKENEKLWDIAKSHNARVSDLKRDNDIRSDVVPSDMMIKIFA